MMGSLLQYTLYQLEMTSNKWVASCGGWEGGGWKEPKVSTCIWQVSK